ncbi:class I adenylate-forming enzyme family protein [Streptomyces sp. NPDC001904]|uniref:class I adenylate-forming enzyme family protein n=1 Tax=Streptomyces sp. NPDC001904 TaxID=3154531 RepID=UPI00331BCDE1
MPHPAHPDTTLDGLLRRAAARTPDAPALTSGTTTVTFAALDALTDRVARFLHHPAPTGTAAPVGVANTLDTVFPAAYYGAARAGRPVVLLNPLAGDDTLLHMCAAAHIATALVPGAVAQRLVALRPRLPLLRTIVVTDAGTGPLPPATLALDDALRSAPPAAPVAAAADPAAPACVQFTTGTTGPAKGVRLTHRNLLANAEQTALAHRLDADAITLNHLPLFHPMHLNSALWAGARQILCPDPDPLAALDTAAAHGASHYYSLPARLHRLAADARLTPRRMPRLRAVMSGGSALAPQAARRLRTALGVPVLQGYGLAELSPLSHMQHPDDPVEHGAVGRAVARTECRIVDLATRRGVEVWTSGEIQVRGPQVMAGYLDPHAAPAVDAEGWLSTGDAGWLDDEGRLHVVDRLDDVFKHDNELVAPSRIEHVLAADPRVAECAAAGSPHPVHGHLTWAAVVLHTGTGDGTPAPRAVLASIAARANRRLAGFEQIRRIDVLDALPRTPTGKPDRRTLRALARAAADRPSPPKGHPAMAATAPATPGTGRP